MENKRIAYLDALGYNANTTQMESSRRFAQGVGMPTTMARIRITIDTEEAHKRAFLSAASLRGLSPQELFEEMVETHCPEDLERARAALAESEDSEDDQPPKKAKK